MLNRFHEQVSSTKQLASQIHLLELTKLKHMFSICHFVYRIDIYYKVLKLTPKYPMGKMTNSNLPKLDLCSHYKGILLE